MGDDEGSEEPISKKKRKDDTFSVRKFTNSLRREDCFTVLQKFVKNCENPPDGNDPSLKFLQEGGKFLEVIDVLHRNPDADFSDVTSVFKALRFLINRTVTHLPQLKATAEEACGHLLGHHLNIIHKLLNASSYFCQRSVLDLLSYVVMLSPRLSCEILKHVNFDAAVIERLAKHGTKSKMQTARKSFIHFLLAFLMNGNTLSARMLLEKKGFLTSIIPGLQYDESATVVFVLESLRNNLVEVKEISKTQKMQIFSTPVIQSLLELYKWMGPGGFKWKKSSKQKDVETEEAEVDEQQRQLVAESVHALLLMLCSWHKYGVVFHDPSCGTSGKNLNQLMTSVLKGITQPWEHALLKDLVLKIVGACPEMAGVVFDSVLPYIEPRLQESWLNIITFVTQVVQSLNVETLCRLETGPFNRAAKALLVPRFLITVGKSGIRHPEGMVRMATGRMLIEFLNVILTVRDKRKAVTGDSSANLMLYISSVLPAEADVKCAWLSAQSPVSRAAVKESPPPVEQMVMLVDILYLYQQHFPSILQNQQSLVTTVSVVLTMESKGGDSDLLVLQVKALQFLTNIEHFKPTAEKVKFLKIATLLLQATNVPNDLLASEACDALGNLLLGTRLLEPYAVEPGGELIVWLHCWSSVEPEHRPTVLAFLSDVLSGAAFNIPSYMKKVLEAYELFQDRSVKQKESASTVNKLFKELCVAGEMLRFVDDDYQDVGDVIPSVELSVLFLAAVDVASKCILPPPVEKFLSCVLVHILHLQADPEPFLYVVDQWKAIPLSTALYLKGWGRDDGPPPLESPFGSTSLESRLSHQLLVPHYVQLELNNINPATIILLTRIVVFHIAQLSKHQKLATATADVALSALTDLLFSSDMEQDREIYLACLKTIFKHPVLVHHFHPLSRNPVEMAVSRFVSGVLLKARGTKKEMYEVDKMTVLLKKQLERDMDYHLLHPEKTTRRSRDLKSAVGGLPFSYAEMSVLIGRIVPVMFARPWSALMEHLLGFVELLPSRIVHAIGIALVTGISNHDVEDGNSAVIVESFRCYLERFPFCTQFLPTELLIVAVKSKHGRLAETLLRHKQTSRSSPLAPLILDAGRNLLTRPNDLFPLLDIEWLALPKNIQTTVMLHYERDIMQALDFSQTAPDYIVRHPNLIAKLIACIELDECKKVCKKLAETAAELERCSLFQLAVLQGLWRRNSWVEHASELTSLLVHQLIRMLNSHNNFIAEISYICSILLLHFKDEDVRWTEHPLKTETVYRDVCQRLLLFALRPPEDSDADLKVQLLVTYAYLIDRTKDPILAEYVFEMATTHSQFLAIVLRREETGLKLSLLALLYSCGGVAPNVMQTTHIPVWLGGYSATLSHCDQMLLKLLERYETSGLDLYDYRPFLWGEAAVSHFSVRSSAGMSLWRVPQGSQALELLTPDLVQATIAHFPSRRSMIPERQEEEARIHSEDKKIEVKQRRGNVATLKQIDLLLFPLVRLEKSRSNVYDPAFIMPLLSHVLAPESLVKTFKFFRTGAMALTLATLSSGCPLTRAAAASVLSRYHSHLESNRSTNVNQLIHYFVEVVRGGIKSLIKDKEIKKERKVTPCVPSLSATFLAKASLILLEANHPLYSAMQSLVLLKPNLSLDGIPGLVSFLRVNRPDYRLYQYWMLECIRDGIQTYQDVTLLAHHYSLLQGFFSSTLCTTPLQILILQILEMSFSIPRGCVVLMRKGLLPWLYCAISQTLAQGVPGMAMGMLRVVVMLQQNYPELTEVSLPLLDLLPHTLSRQNLCWILKLALNAVDHLTPKDISMVLRWCYPVVGYEAVREYTKQLRFFAGVSEGPYISDDLSEIHEDNESPRRIVADDETLLNDVKVLTGEWLKIHMAA